MFPIEVWHPEIEKFDFSITISQQLTIFIASKTP